jgi:hypothetical protein
VTALLGSPIPSTGSPQPEALDLPELDKGEEGDEVDVGSFVLSLTDDDEQEDDSATDTFEVDIQVLTDSGGNEAATDLDVGVSDLLEALPEGPEDRDSVPPAPTTAELDLHLDTPLESDDPSSDAELGDDGLEELPELLSEEGDGDAGPDLERAFLPSAPEGEIAKGPPYASEWLVLGNACGALWAGAGSVLAAGEQLMTFGRERRSEALPAGTRIASLTQLDNGNTVMATTRGLLERGPSGTWSFAEAPEPPRGSGAEAVELAAARGAHVLWARLANGALWRRRAGGWEKHEAGGEVHALTSYDERLTLLVISHRPTLQLSSDAGSSFRELVLPEPAATVALGAEATAVSRGNVVALADSERGLCVSSDGGETFRMVTGAVNVTAVAIGEGESAGRVFAALHREGKDASELIAVDPGNGHALGIAEVAGEPDEEAEETGRTQALVFADGYLWAAGLYGLVRLRR